MNEPLDPLESRLSRQALRGAPSYLRRRILASAQTVATPRLKSTWPWHGEFPWAWGALASVWIVALAGSRVDRWIAGSEAAVAAVPAEQRVLARLQREELSEAIGGNWRGLDSKRAIPDRVMPDAVPQPRSELRLRPALRPLGWSSVDSVSV